MNLKSFFSIFFLFFLVFLFLSGWASGFSVSQPSQDEYLAAASQASAQYGLRPELLVGLFAQETSFGSPSGLGKTKGEWSSYCTSRSTTDCENWKKRDCDPNYSPAPDYFPNKDFDPIVTGLGYSPDEVPISSTCAMGFMQFLPATWQDYGLGDPWNINDAFSAAAKYLFFLDAKTDERTALQKYYCGPTNYQGQACQDYADDVLQKAGEAAKLSFPGVSLFGLQLEYPDWLPLRPDMGLTELVFTIFNTLLVIGGLATFLSIVIGGFHYLTAFGNPAKLADAKNQVVSALVGLTLLLASFLILNYINPQLVELKQADVKPMPGTLTVYPGMLTVRVVLKVPVEQESEHYFARETAETVELAKIDSKELKLSFEPDKQTIELFLEGSRETIWREEFTSPLSAKIDWQEDKDTAGKIKIKGTVILNIGPPIYLERRDVGALEWVPFGKSIEDTINLLGKGYPPDYFSGKTILEWMKEFRQKTIERSRDNCGGAESSYHYKTCDKECPGDGCCGKWLPIEVCGKDGCRTIGWECSVPLCSPGDCCTGWQSTNSTCQAGSCNDAKLDHTPCGGTAKEGEINNIAGTIVADLDSGTLGQAIKNLEDPDFKNVFNKALNQVVNCLNQEGYLLLSCEDAEIWFEDESGGKRLTKDITELKLWPCEVGKDFICTWAEGEGESIEEFAQKIVFPIEYLKDGYTAVQKLLSTLYKDIFTEGYEGRPHCQCLNMNSYCDPQFPDPPGAKDWTCSVGFCSADRQCAKVPCEGVSCDENSLCSNPCLVPAGVKEEAPFPKGFKEARDNARRFACGDDECGVVSAGCVFDSLDMAYDTLKRSLEAIKDWSTFDALDTCEETKSILGAYLNSGNEADCPGQSIYPCCPALSIYGIPLDETIKNCSPTDFFFCNPVTELALPTGPLPPGPPGGDVCPIGVEMPVKFPAEEFPKGPTKEPTKRPLVCAPGQIKDCEGPIESSKQWDDASDALKNLIKCIYKNAPEDPGPISSISDSNIPERGGTDGCDLDKCKMSGACFAGACGNAQRCQHSCRSKHYGGTCLSQKSYAVDLADESKYNMLRKLLIEDKVCDKDAGGVDTVLFEGDHIHITVKGAAGCLD